MKKIVLIIWEINLSKAGVFVSSLLQGVNLTPLFLISRKANQIII